MTLTAKPQTAFIRPAKALRGEISVPGDKSISHRAVFFGSIANGTTEVENLLEGDDNVSTINAFRTMGIEVEKKGAGRLSVKGRGLRGLSAPKGVIDAGNSGTTARLITGLLSAQPFTSTIDGDESLRKRPMRRVVEPLTLMGASIKGRDGAEYLPLTIEGRRLKGISYKTKVASAQVKSSIVLAGLYAEGETVVEEPMKSRDHTERMLKLFGADIEVNGNAVRVRSGRELRAASVNVPGDISSAAFFMVAAMIMRDSELLLKNVGVNPTRCGIIDVLEKMGGKMKVVSSSDKGEPAADFLVAPSRLRGVEISEEELLPAIDEFPIICVAAAFAEGVTKITGAKELRVKESDRIRVMAESLGAVGIKTEELPDGIIIEGGVPRGGAIKSRGDHRISMCMAVLALASENGVEIEDPSCASVSFPGFFEILDRVTVK